jgi:starch phosphorylase
MTLSLHSLPAPNPRSSEPETLAKEIVDRLTYRVGKDPTVAKPHDWLQAVILITRDRAIEYWMNATRTSYLER